MIIHKNPKDHILFLLLLLLPIHIITTNAGASSPQKNLVNLYAHPSSDNLNLTSSNIFQNEYQHRQASAKSTSSDRYKSSIPHSQIEAFLSNRPLNDTTIYEYPYPVNRTLMDINGCEGRLKLSETRGHITEGRGHYPPNLQCVWLIDSGSNNATIRIRIHSFNTECNYDFLYVFDGDSIYSPLVAALSGYESDFSPYIFHVGRDEIKSAQNNSTSYNDSPALTEFPPGRMDSFDPPENFNPSDSPSLELITYSGKAFIYFHSDTAQSMKGFYMTYSIDACPLDCSYRGECDSSTLKCKCNGGYYGDGCQYTLCPNDCTSITNGICDEMRSCICHEGFHGEDCSRRDDNQSWLFEPLNSTLIQPRAFHQAIMVNETMWIIGGRTQSLGNTNMGIFANRKTQMVLSFDVVSHKWNNFTMIGTTGVDHLAELSGHSVANHGDIVFIYGGLAMNNTVLDTLTVLDTKKKSLSLIVGSSRMRDSNQFEQLKAPIPVVGHTANIVDGNMYVFLGYNPVYGYINLVQKFNTANNSWSIVEKKGSSINGCIGHSSTFDPNSRLIYVYGGHDAYKSSKLYSFDTHTETWTFLQPGLSPRHYHSAAIIDQQLIIFGGNSYNTTSLSDQCFDETYLTYELSCSYLTKQYSTYTNSSTDCVRKCWRTIDDPESRVLKRKGHSIVTFNKTLILYGGFNGLFLNDIQYLNIGTCDAIQSESECVKPKFGINCQWNVDDKKCEQTITDLSGSSGGICSRGLLKPVQLACETRETCADCLSTSIGCVWCGYLSQCQYAKCKLSSMKPITELDFCYKDTYNQNNSFIETPNNQMANNQAGNQEADLELDCKVDNCHLCHTKPHCSWRNEACSYDSHGVITSPASGLSVSALEEANDQNSNLGSEFKNQQSNSSHAPQRLEQMDKSFIAALAGLMNSAPRQLCDIPCYMRKSCNECTTTKCIWCSTTEQCIDSTAYFAYYPMGQCMHYVAHMLKCPSASCAEIQSCDMCLANPRCGWLNDISNTGKGRCIEGDSSGPSFGSLENQGVGTGYNETINSEATNGIQKYSTALANWYFSSCPSCQCNGHSYCRYNSSICVQGCQDNTSGPHCDRCIQGYYGDPINGGVCKPCRCNGHAQSCNRETGKCYCSTKGIIGHNCSRCDDKNFYLGDPSSPGNGTCYYNLTTDYQYTFNMSKPEDLFYSDINLINVPLRRDSDVDFTIACSRLALVNITAGVSYKNRRPLHTNLECGSFRLRFPHDRHSLSDANYSFFVHVYRFQTPFVLQIAFSQHRTLYLPQFFFTFSSFFLFFFALSGLVWKLKHEYHLYIRRQRQFIEMEQMASRPFSSVFLEIFKPSSQKPPDHQIGTASEPTPVSFEPCFGSNIGVMSLFVQLPGKPNLAIGSALVSLNDDTTGFQDQSLSKRPSNNDNSDSRNL